MGHYNNGLDVLIREALLERGLLPEMPPDALAEAERLKQHPFSSCIRDLREIPFVSIDNEDSLDLDQLTYAEKNRVYVAIANVDAYVRRGSAIDRYARHNTTSIYAPGKLIPMLPLRLSNDLTSLNEDQERCAVVIELEVSGSGKSSLRDLYLAVVCNHKKLDYSSVSRWLAGEGVWPSEELQKQLILQDRLAQKMLSYRFKQGALRFKTIELMAILEHGVAVTIKAREDSRSLQLIESFMIAANMGVTTYFMEQGLPVLRRVVRVPKRWDRIVHLAHKLGEKLPAHPNVQALRDFLIKQNRKRPEQFHDLSLAIIKLIGRGEYVVSGREGHFDLALRDYAHTTAPNRRYPDLVMQRVLMSHLNDDQRLSEGELVAIAHRCTEKEDDVMKVERKLIKCAAAMMLSGQIGKSFYALVTGAGPKGMWVRLMAPPIEGKVVRGYEGLDVGDRVVVVLLKVDVRAGHIDFGRVSSHKN